jgi:hypothetical protein
MDPAAPSLPALVRAATAVESRMGHWPSVAGGSGRRLARTNAGHADRAMVIRGRPQLDTI